MEDNNVAINQMYWNELWKEAMKRASGVASWSDSGAKRGIKRWEERFSRPVRTGDDSYVNQFLQKIEVDSNSTVLDIGCGSGILTIPLAKRVKSVTALDVSGEMLDLARKRAAEEGLSNIAYINRNWEDVILGKEIDKHDVVIASRSLGMFDLRSELAKLNAAAKKRVYLTNTAEENDHFREEVYKVIGKDYHQLPGYIYIYNLLYHAGISAHISFLECEIEERYLDINKAVDVWRWRIAGLTVEEEEKLIDYLSRALIKMEDGGFTTPAFNCIWAMVYWKPIRNLATQKKVKTRRVSQINWNKLWKEALKKTPWFHRSEEPALWNSISERFNKGVHRDWMKRSSYINKFLRKIDVDSSSTVLDLGCGPGTLTIPLAKKVKSVTALDISSEMLDLVRKNAAEGGLSNIVCINKSWEDVSLGKEIDKHDIVIASRSLGGLDLKEKLLKMNRAAERSVYLTWITQVSDSETKAYEAINREYRQEPGYIYIYNMLYQMGIYANVDFIECKSQEYFSDLDDAMKYYRWIMKGVNEEEEEKLRAYLVETLVKTKEGGLATPLSQNSRWAWAFIRWAKDNKQIAQI